MIRQGKGLGGGDKERRDLPSADPVTKRSSSDHHYRSFYVGSSFSPSQRSCWVISVNKTLETNLVAFSIPEAFFSLLKLTLYTSLFSSIPVIFYQIWKAFTPLFRSKGLSSGNTVLITAILLFYLGAFFCFFVTLPFGVQFLLGYQSAHIKPMISAGKYVSFCTVFIFGFGLTFELPLILALLSYLRVVNAAFLTRNRRYAILSDCHSLGGSHTDPGCL